MSHSRKRRHAISVVISNVVMIAIVLAISAGLIFWAQSSLGVFSSGSQIYYHNNAAAAQERFVIEKVFFNPTYTCDNQNCDGPNSRGQIRIFVRNLGQEEIKVVGIYVNATLYQQFNSTTCAPTGNQTQTVLIPAGGGASSACDFNIVWPHTWLDGTMFSIVVASSRGNQARFEGSSLGPPTYVTLSLNATFVTTNTTSTSTPITTTMTGNATITDCNPTTISTTITSSSISTSKSITTYTTSSTIYSTTSKTTSAYTTTSTSLATSTYYSTTLTTSTYTKTSKSITTSTSTGISTSTSTGTITITSTITTTPGYPQILTVQFEAPVACYQQIAPMTVRTTTQLTTTTSSQTTTTTSTFPIATTYTTTTESTFLTTGTSTSLSTTKSTSTYTVTGTGTSTKTTFTTRTTYAPTTVTRTTSTKITRTVSINPITTTYKTKSTYTELSAIPYTTTVSGMTQVCTTYTTITSGTSTISSSLPSLILDLPFADWFGYMSVLMFSLLFGVKRFGATRRIRIHETTEGSA
jgi:hypothetical protein